MNENESNTSSSAHTDVNDICIDMGKTSFQCANDYDIHKHLNLKTIKAHITASIHTEMTIQLPNVDELDVNVIKKMEQTDGTLVIINVCDKNNHILVEEFKYKITKLALSAQTEKPSKTAIPIHIQKSNTPYHRRGNSTDEDTGIFFFSYTSTEGASTECHTSTGGQTPPSVVFTKKSIIQTQMHECLKNYGKEQTTELSECASSLSPGSTSTDSSGYDADEDDDDDFYFGDFDEDETTPTITIKPRV